MENLEAITSEAKAAIAAAQDGATLEQLRVDYLGKKGQITSLLKAGTDDDMGIELEMVTA